jgi:hypothetical protein
MVAGLRWPARQEIVIRRPEVSVPVDVSPRQWARLTDWSLISQPWDRDEPHLRRVETNSTGSSGERTRGPCHA